ncbi:DNA repair protein XRCC2 [Passerculus sandwichensis]
MGDAFGGAESGTQVRRGPRPAPRSPQPRARAHGRGERGEAVARGKGSAEPPPLTATGGRGGAPAGPPEGAVREGGREGVPPPGGRGDFPLDFPLDFPRIPEGSGFPGAVFCLYLRARLEGRSSLKNLEPCLFAEEGSPVHGDVIEFHGPEGTGKTEMLYHLLARCILAKAQGGLEVEVMFVDTDYHFDMLRLVTILENRLAQGTEEMIKQCLGRLFLVSCSSSTQLLLTLYSLENLFCAHPSLCVLILDSLSAFYWIDRSNGGESLTLQEMNLKKCANFLEKLVTQHHLILFATTQTLMQKSANSAEGFLPSKLPHETDTDYRPYLCKSWQQMVTHRMFFSKQCNSGSSKGFTVVSCHLKRNQVVKRSFSVAECGVQF